MAKTFHEKRKRIAHNKTSFNEEHEIYPEDYDIVTTIMKGMSSNLSTHNFETSLMQSGKTFTRKEVQNSMSIPTISENYSSAKSKKFGLSRKFPLMEKSQKALKQLKHNQKIPKPRAHLAGLSNSSPLKNSSHTVKCKKTKVVRKKIEKCLSKLTPQETSDKPAHKRKNLELKNVSEKQKSCITNSSVEESSDVDTSSFHKADNDSSDSEYEKFIQKETKNLGKKSTRKKKTQPSKKVSKKHTSKAIHKPVLTESDSESDETSKPYYKNNKRLKSIDTEKDVINDETCHDSFSESDTVHDKPSKCDPHDDQISVKQNQLPHPKQNPFSKINLDIPSDTLSFIDNDQSDVASLVGDQTTILHTSSTPFMSTDQSNIPKTECSTLKSEPIHNHGKESSAKAVIDLTESDNENETLPKIVMVSSQSQNDAPSCSEESDIELVDVIVYPLKTNSMDKVNIKTEKVNQTFSCSNSDPHKSLELSNGLQNSSNIRHEAVYATNICKEHESTDKTVKHNSNNDNLPGSILNILEDSFVLKKVKEEPCNDCEIVFDATPSSKSTKDLLSVQKCNNTFIKTERESKGLTASASVSNDTLTNNKTLDTLTQKEQILHEVACSNFRNLTSSCNNRLELPEKEKNTKPPPTDIKSTLQALKEEFATYQEIIQTEQFVESTFKLLEKRQAERLISLKSRMVKLIESTSSTDNSSILKEAMTNLLDGTALNSSQSSKDCMKMPSTSPDTCLPQINTDNSKITTDDLKKFASLNLVPLSSISQKDIKPNLFDLQQHVIKQEASTSNETNCMSFGEKCIVCTKEASAACQQCAKVFFCSDECGMKYWESGHKETCVK